MGSTMIPSRRRRRMRMTRPVRLPINLSSPFIYRLALSWLSYPCSALCETICGLHDVAIPNIPRVVVHVVVPIYDLYGIVRE